MSAGRHQGRAESAPGDGLPSGAEPEPCSVLFPDGAAPEEPAEAPAFFRDLYFDQIVDTVIAGKDEYRLAPFFSMPLHDPGAVRWRQDVMRDVEKLPVLEAIEAFARQLQTVRRDLARAEKLPHEPQKHRWFLDAVRAYCAGVRGLARRLSSAPLASRGLAALRDYVVSYAQSERFATLDRQAEQLGDALAAIRYDILIDGLNVEVRRHAERADYSVEVEAAFEKFRQGAPKDYAFRFRERTDLSSVEERILDGVARLFPDTFGALAAFCAANSAFQDPTIARFDREIQFYVAVLAHVTRLRRAGLHFCFPHVTTATKVVYDEQGYDLALAFKLVAEGKPVVCNDFRLEGRERIIVVSGPNQGGKTTFARTFGQLHYLASLGLPVAGVRAQVFLCDRLFTHFERQEDPGSLHGKLEDDLLRIREILERATPRSVVILNEIFTSTTLQDALLLSRRIAARIIALDVLCVWVTFLDELASLGEQTVSMVSTVVPENPAERTYKIVRAPANGLAYALSIAEKYGLDAVQLRRRLEAGR